MPRQVALATLLNDQARVLAAASADRHLEASPELRERFPAIRIRCAEDGESHIHHLAAALAMGRGEVFDRYVAWAAQLLAGPGIDGDHLVRHLDILAEVIDEHPATDAAAAAAVRRMIAHSVAVLPEGHADPVSELLISGIHQPLAASVLAALLQGDRRQASRLVGAAVEEGVGLEALYLQVFQPCLREVGRLWQTGRVTVGQEHLVTAAVQLLMAQLYPQVFATPRIGRSAIIASVGGELHEIGARMVGDVFELHGWDSHFTGANTPTRGVAALAVDLDVDVVAISATLPSHLPMVGSLVQALREAGDAKILVGGRPFLQVPDLWQVVSADGTAPDAATAVATATALLGATP